MILSLVVWAMLHDSSWYSAANVGPLLTKESFKALAIDLESDTKLSLTESSLKLFGLLYFPNNVLMSVQPVRAVVNLIMEKFRFGITHLNVSFFISPSLKAFCRNLTSSFKLWRNPRGVPCVDHGSLNGHNSVQPSFNNVRK